VTARDRKHEPVEREGEHRRRDAADENRGEVAGLQSAEDEVTEARRADRRGQRSLPTVHAAEVRSPATIVGKASGNSTRRNRWARVIPTPRAASITAGSMPDSTVTVLRSIGSRLESVRPRKAGRAPIPDPPTSASNSLCATRSVTASTTVVSP
jgi:hypothetical protein